MFPEVPYEKARGLLNTSSFEELTKFIPELDNSGGVRIHPDEAKQIIAARPLQSWRDVAAAIGDKGPNYPRTHVMHSSGFRLNEPPPVAEKSYNMLRDLHNAAKELTEATPPIPLKLLAVSQHSRYVRSYLGSIFDLPSKKEYAFCGELYTRAYVTRDEINGATLLLCVCPDEVEYLKVQSLNEQVARTFDPHVPMIFSSLRNSRLVVGDYREARMMRLVSPTKFLESGIWMLIHSNYIDMPGTRNGVNVGALPQTHPNVVGKNAWCACCNSDLARHFKNTTRLRKQELSSIIEKCYGRKVSVPFAIGMSGKKPGKQWEQDVDWRANVWSELLQRIPEDVVSTFYRITAPEIFGLLSDEQLKAATLRFQDITARTQACRLHLHPVMRENYKTESKQVEEEKSEMSVEEETRALRGYIGGVVNTMEVRKRFWSKHSGVNAHNQVLSYERNRRPVSYYQRPGFRLSEVHIETDFHGKDKRGAAWFGSQCSIL